ncbi:MAG: DUF4062 domain-containing protein [Rhodopirellula sp.]|nr:DUF4062 domain-containing protein [Rhodopirellula sp.]
MNTSHQPHQFLGVTVSSTFTDLKEHRAALIQAINGLHLHPVVMENDAAKPVDVIESSLQMVRQGAAYIGIIGKKYGQVPKCAKRNPENLSITELEFNAAVELGRPILLFIMGKDHLVREDDIEMNAAKKRKLKSFTERAKKMSEESSVHRIYAAFDSLADFTKKIGPSLAELRLHLDQGDVRGPKDEVPVPTIVDPNSIPKPPAFYAEPDYIGSHQFVGRDSQLQELSDWAKPADPTNLLLFEAIGGNGKSMLTWEWTTNPRHALAVRSGKDQWAGRFWYSFYERGAIMADFCQRALAYMTGQPLKEFRKKKTAELREPLLAQLHARPWLLILDGLERVLVAYHRIDAAEMPDEEANSPTDKIVNRNPCDAIRDEDNDLLRALAAATPSKILVSSRLTPRVLLNPSGQPITGAKRITLLGLRPPDAEQLLRSCGIEGDSAAIQSYLTTNGDNHPLVIGILGGLIHNYLPARGNFDAWAVDGEGGAKLDLGSLDIIQRRNHILHAAVGALSESSRDLLLTLAILSESVDYETLTALNPLLPDPPAEVPVPGKRPDQHADWSKLSRKAQQKRTRKHETKLRRRSAYEVKMGQRTQTAEYRAATNELAVTVSDLEQRGLLHYDRKVRRYEMHPVVRSVAVGRLGANGRLEYGQRLIDHFSAVSNHSYRGVTSREELKYGIHVARTWIHMQRYNKAYNALLDNGLLRTLLHNFEDYEEVLAFGRTFFDQGWRCLPTTISKPSSALLSLNIGLAFRNLGKPTEAIQLYVAAIPVFLQRCEWYLLRAAIGGLASTYFLENKQAKSIRYDRLGLKLAESSANPTTVFVATNRMFKQLSTLGQWAEAEKMLKRRDRVQYLISSSAEQSAVRAFLGKRALDMARVDFFRGVLNNNGLSTHERTADSLPGRRTVTRGFRSLRGAWRLEQGEWALAAESFAEAVRMARESGIPDAESETRLALAKHHLGQLAEPQHEAERLAQLRQPAHRTLAQLWLALGDPMQAKHHALAAYKWAWADGEPYVHRYELTKTTELLQQMNVPIPNLPPYDPARDEPFPWEADVRAAIEKLRAEKKARRKSDEAADE